MSEYRAFDGFERSATNVGVLHLREVSVEVFFLLEFAARKYFVYGNVM